MVGAEEGLGVGLRDATDEVHEGVAARQHLRELVGLQAGADGHLGPEGAQRFRRVRTPDRRPHLVRGEQRLHDRPSDDAGCAGHHHRHGLRLRERACEDAAMPDDADRSRIRAATGLRPVSMVPARRQLQLDQGRVALRWACHELDIPLPA